MRQVSPTLVPPSRLLSVSVAAARRVAVIAVPPSLPPSGWPHHESCNMQRCLHRLSPSLPPSCVALVSAYAFSASLAAAFRVPPIMREEDHCPHGRTIGVERVKGAERGEECGKRRSRIGARQHLRRRRRLLDCHCTSGRLNVGRQSGGA